MPHSYLVKMLTTLLLTSACIVLLCFTVDPYKLFAPIPGLSPKTSVDLFYYLRLHKPYAVEDIEPSILILGSSRSAGLSPLTFGGTENTAYNAAMPGATMREIRQMLEHAHAINPLRSVLIGVDFSMFREGTSDSLAADEAHRYRRVDPTLRQRWQHTSQQVSDYWRSLFSADAIMDSLRILVGSGRSQRAYYDDGTWDMDGTLTLPPHRRYATQSRLSYSWEIANKENSVIFDELLDVLDFADAHKIRVTVIISPLQALLMQTLHLADTWEQYLDWQQELVETIGARKTVTEVYGLENSSELVLERIDAPRALFRDGVHYTQRTSAEILSCLAGPCDSSIQLTRLDKNNVAAYLDQVDLLRKQYVQQNPEDIRAVRKWLNLSSASKTDMPPPL